MNTYRVYVLNTAAALLPVVTIAYVQGEKYGDAWKAARAALSNQAVKGSESAGVPKLFADAEAKTPSDVGHGDHVVVAKVDDIKPRNVKMDKAALQNVVNDSSLSDSDKIKALMAQLNGGVKTASTVNLAKPPKTAAK